MKKFIVDFEGEEEVPQDQHATFLPRYIYTGDEKRDWATDRARASWSPDKPMWIAKILILEVYDKKTQKWVQKDAPIAAWSILTNSKSYKGLSHLYYIDTGGRVPEVAGAPYEVMDANGTGGIIELASELEPAPWWERPDKEKLIETVMNMLDFVETEDLYRTADFLAIRLRVPGLARGTARDLIGRRRLYGRIQDALTQHWDAEGVNEVREWIESNINIAEEDDDDEDEI